VMSELLGTLHGRNGLLGGHVRMSFVATAKYFAPRLIAAFMKQHPQIDPRITIGNRSIVVSSLRGFEADIALMGRPPEDFNVTSKSIGPHPHVIIAPPDHPLTRKVHISKKDLVKENFILREEGSGTRSMFEYFFSGFAMRADKVKIQIASNETVKQAVIAGLGLALISAHTIESEVASCRLAVLNVDGLPIVREWYAVHRSDRVLTPAGRAMWNFIMTKGREFLPKTELPAPKVKVG